jgi:tRNA G18 (ribose-2'-O)-methylase SpoU
LKEGGDESSSSKSGVFVAEGPETIKMLLRSDVHVESLLLKTAVYARLAADIQQRFGRVPSNVFVVVVVDGQSSFTSHVGYTARGALGVGRVPIQRSVTWLRESILLRKAPSEPWRLLGIDNSNNPANVGSMLRTARALGVDAVLLSGGCCDAWYRRCVRVSMGHCFHIPIVRCGKSMADDLVMLRESDGVECYSAVITDDAASAHELVARGAEGGGSLGRGGRWCCVVGSEHGGVSEEVMAVTKKIRIPMTEGVDSLSITSAASILIDQLRQNDAAVCSGEGGGRTGGRTGDACWMLTTLVVCAAVGVVIGRNLRK